jgi:hypothetical protein
VTSIKTAAPQRTLKKILKPSLLLAHFYFWNLKKIFTWLIQITASFFYPLQIIVKSFICAFFMWYSKEYNPIQVGSIDGTDIDPHDYAVFRATLSSCMYIFITQQNFFFM